MRKIVALALVSVLLIGLLALGGNKWDWLMDDEEAARAFAALQQDHALVSWFFGVPAILDVEAPHIGLLTLKEIQEQLGAGPATSSETVEELQSKVDQLEAAVQSTAELLTQTIARLDQVEAAVQSTAELLVQAIAALEDRESTLTDEQVMRLLKYVVCYLFPHYQDPLIQCGD